MSKLLSADALLVVIVMLVVVAASTASWLGVPPAANSVQDQESSTEESSDTSDRESNNGVGLIGLIIVGLGSGFTVKVVDILYSEYARRRSTSENTSSAVAANLDPILKSADELVGKLRSLAEKDFVEFRNLDGAQADETIALGDTLYLFAQFWARLEILRKESIYAHISADRTGQRLRMFLRCLESRRVRLLERARTRAIGEILLTTSRSGLECKGFREFFEELEGTPRVKEWIAPLERLLRSTNHTRERQHILQYGVVLHAMIDTLDPKHIVTRVLPAFPNKLTKKTRQGLVFRVFRVYLPEVKNRAKYTDVSSRSAP